MSNPNKSLQFLCSNKTYSFSLFSGFPKNSRLCLNPLELSQFSFMILCLNYDYEEL